MADIRFQVQTEFINSLRDRLGAGSYGDLIRDALTILNWAVEERERGRLVLSSDKNGGSVERLAMPSLMRVQEQLAEHR